MDESSLARLKVALDHLEEAASVSPSQVPSSWDALLQRLEVVTTLLEGSDSTVANPSMVATSMVANPGYAAGRALAEHAKLEDLRRDVGLSAAIKADRVAKWNDVLGGILGGTLSVGSRTPVADCPSWVTLEVLGGGFTSGRHLAALTPEDEPNETYVSGKGAALLEDMLESGQYAVDLPEHGALLVFIQMMRSGREREARELLAQIAPWFDRLRFYPRPTVHPIQVSPLVSVATVQDVRCVLRGLVRNEATLVLKSGRRELAWGEALVQWVPIKLDLLQLFAETVEGPPPRWESKPVSVDGRDGERTTGEEAARRAVATASGWPCARIPAGWAARAAAVLDRYDAQVREHAYRLIGWLVGSWRETVLTSRMQLRAGEGAGERFLTMLPDHVRERAERLRPLLCRTQRGSLATLLACARAIVAHGGSTAALSGIEVGRLRCVMAGWAAKHSDPTSEEFARYRASLPALAARHKSRVRRACAAALLERLGPCAADEGLEAPGAMLQPVALRSDDGEGVGEGATTSVAVPLKLAQLLERSLRAPLSELCARGLIKSSEEFARLVPSLMSACMAAGGDEPAARRLRFALYRAFSRRPSLLLLNLEHQVRIEELPWAAPLLAAAAPYHEGEAPAPDEVAVAATRQCLELVVREAMRAFPARLLPNKLLQSLRDLLKRARLSAAVALTEELAADIFDGRFTPKYARAAHQASLALAGSPYERYYGLGRAFAALSRMVDEGTAEEERTRAFGRFCTELAPEIDASFWLSRNHAIIEAQQLLTTHNLVPLLHGLGLCERGLLDTEALALAAWKAIVHEYPIETLSLAVKGKLANHGLRRAIAVAWRQTVILLSLTPPAGQSTLVERFGAWLRGRATPNRSAQAQRGYEAVEAALLTPLAEAIAGKAPTRPPFLGTVIELEETDVGGTTSDAGGAS